MALVSGWYIPKYRMFFLVFAILISVSRVLAGVHTPLDILAGWFVGVSFAFLAYVHLDLINWIERDCK
jgi:membrane-associated phospholipid phosphatase